MTAPSAEEAELARGLIVAGVAGPLAARIAAYGALLLARNRALNLSAARTPEALLEHLLDALTLREYACGPLIDVGSGGGLPGFVLALCGIDVTLLDATAKKTAFLAQTSRDLEIAGLLVVTGRAEDLARDPALRERFACATARAVACAPAVLELTLPFLAVDGRALLQRGAWEPGERAATLDAAPMLGGAVTQEVLLAGQRRIVIVEKRAATTLRYPRRAGVPAKRPLCLR